MLVLLSARSFCFSTLVRSHLGAVEGLKLLRDLIKGDAKLEGESSEEVVRTGSLWICLQRVYKIMN